MAKTDVMLCFLMLLGFFYCNAAKSDIGTPVNKLAFIRCHKATADSSDLQKSLNIMDLNRRSSEDGKKLFNIADKNGDGSIDVEELKLILECLLPPETAASDAESKAVMEDVDLNGDVELGLDEFLAMLEKILQGSRH